MLGLFYFLLCFSSSFSVLERRIYHGYEAGMDKYPHAVFLHFEGTRPSSCGSSLILSQVVVTAAHCVDELRYDRGSINAYLGHVTPMLATVVRFVVGFRIHPKYKETTGRSNMAVAFLNSRVPLSINIKKIPLANRVPNEDDALFTAGWGKQTVSKLKLPNLPGYRSNPIRVSKQVAISGRKCTQVSGSSVRPTMLCTMPVMGHMHLDDSGNGLIIKSPVPMLMGVLSHVDNGINMYTNVFSNRAWILQAAYTLYRVHCSKLKLLFHQDLIEINNS